MQDVGLAQLVVEVLVDDLQQVMCFLLGNGDCGRVAAVFPVSGADQGKAVQVRDAEDDALVFILQNVGMFTFIQARHDNVAALDQADAVRRIELEVVLDEAGHPRAGGVDQRAGMDRLEAAVGVLQFYLPQALYTFGAQAAGAGVDVCAQLTGRHGVEYYQAGVIDSAVGVFEAAGDCRLQRVARAEAQATRGAQALALAQVVVEEQAGADHPCRAQVRAVRKHEAHRFDDVRGLGQQHFAFSQGLAYEAKLVVLQVAQATVNQFAAG